MYQSISIQDIDYPAILKEIYDAPSQLFYEGDLSLLNTNILSIIGTRKPSLYGDAVLDIMLKGISDESITICSGLAYGIDQLASHKALELGLKNIIVLAHGLDMTYPYKGHTLREKILQDGGLILSEYSHGHKPQKWQFIKRNRIIAGLSPYLLIPEADMASGSLSTARLALENNRNVLAIPGNITSPSSRGTNWLLSQGAIPINNSDDLRAELGFNTKKNKTTIKDINNEAQIELLQLLQTGLDNTEDIAERLHKPIHEILITLTSLELNGIIKSDDTGRIIAL